MFLAYFLSTLCLAHTPTNKNVNPTRTKIFVLSTNVLKYLVGVNNYQMNEWTSAWKDELTIREVVITTKVSGNRGWVKWQNEIEKWF